MKKKKLLASLLFGVVCVADTAFSIRTAYRVGVVEEQVDELEKMVEEMEKKRVTPQAPLRQAVLKREGQQHTTPTDGLYGHVKKQPLLESAMETHINQYFSALQKHLSVLEEKMLNELRSINAKIADSRSGISEICGESEDKPV